VFKRRCSPVAIVLVCIRWYEKAIEAFGALFETIEDCRVSTQSAFESYAHDAVADILYGNVHAEIDQ